MTFDLTHEVNMTIALEIALVKIHASIPPEILEYAFANRELRNEVVSIDDMILQKVIRYRVLKDMNVEGGKFKEILLRHSYMEPLARNYDDNMMHTGRWSVYRIPPEAREGRPIVEVTNLKFRGAYAGNQPYSNGYTDGANITTMAQGVLDALTFQTAPPIPNVELLSGDLVRLWPSQHHGTLWAMNCRLAYDECLTNLNSSAIQPFADVCVFAVQAYIFINTTVMLDKAYIMNGYQVGQFKVIIDSYADANQKYAEAFEKLSGAMFLDPSRIQAILPYLV
jgi:hypothetical protein